MTSTSIAQEFVDSMPPELQPGVLYISIHFRTTMHLCACGCGNDVVLPLRPSAWSLTYDGESISMSPSVGNWSFACRSHYWIRSGRIDWARDWSNEQVAAGRHQTLVERSAIPPATHIGSEHDPPTWRRILTKGRSRRRLR